jgi:hypothetical protein
LFGRLGEQGRDFLPLRFGQQRTGPRHPSSFDVTLIYFRFVARPTLANWVLFLITSRALIYSNYFGFAVLGYVALDYDFRSSQYFGKSLQFLMATARILLVAYR